MVCLEVADLHVLIDEYYLKFLLTKRYIPFIRIASFSILSFTIYAESSFVNSAKPYHEQSSTVLESSLQKTVKLLGVDVYIDYESMVAVFYSEISSQSTFDYCLSILISNLLLKNRGFFLHASAINFQNNGLIFTAPSGTGKSTQARLWCDYHKAKVINHDKPILRMINDVAYVYGSPWSGMDDSYINEKVRLSIILFIEQASINEVKEIESYVAFNKMMKEFRGMFFDEVDFSLFTNTVNTILESVKHYLFCCTKGREATDVLIPFLRR